MVRYLAIIGMRIIDVFRMFDAENRGYVQKEQFMKGLKVSLVQSTVFFSIIGQELGNVKCIKTSIMLSLDKNKYEIR